MIKPFLPTERVAQSYDMSLLRDLARMMVVERRSHGGGDSAALAEAEFPDAFRVKQYFQNPDRYFEMQMRGASTVTSTGTSNVPKASLVQLLPLLGPDTAIRGIIAASLGIQLGSASIINLPHFSPDATGIAYLAEGAPYPFRQLVTSSTVAVTHKKIGVGFAATAELVDCDGAVDLLSQAISADVALGTETIFFDSIDISATRPKGMRHGVDALTADATGTTAQEKMINDLSALAAVCVAIDNSPIFIMAPLQFLRFNLMKPANFAYRAYPSAALVDGEVACLAPAGIVFAGGAEPRWAVSKETAIIMADPGEVFSTPGSPAAAGAPGRSLLQTDTVALRLTLGLDWTKRSAFAFSHTASVGW